MESETNTDNLKQRIEQDILSTLNTENEIAESHTYAQARGFNHQDVYGQLLSLDGDGYIKFSKKSM